MKSWLGITWGISNRFGWGIYGLNLVLELLQRERPGPVCLGEITTQSMTSEMVAKLQPAIDFRNQHLTGFFRMGQTAQLGDTTVLHALGNGMEWNVISESVEGEANVGVIFFEYTEFPPKAKERLARLNGTVAGSTWNGEVLKNWGVENVETVFQGVDTSIFRPLMREGKYDGKFAIFSGGKLDFRKGQDIVLAAFKIFRERHDDAILVTAWQNLWPITCLPMHYSPYTDTLPDVRPDGTLNIGKWAAEAGVPTESFIDLGMVPNEDMPAILKEMDLAVFPNRCEGGTNLVAMETMACGVPCVIADNTGQKDLIGDDNCYPLRTQGLVELPDSGVDGWGESDLEEMLEAMESAYQNRAEARKKGTEGTEFMQSWTWPNQISQLIDAIDRIT